MSPPRSRQHDAWVALGSNLDDPVTQVRTAMNALDEVACTRVVARSSLYRSAPWGYAEQPDFVNAVARVATGLRAHELLRELLALEQRRGRVRTRANGPRVLDLDLLLYDDECIEEDGLIVPHPRLHERAFVLVPLLEIDADVSVPGVGAAARIVRGMDTRDVRRLAQT